MIGRSTIDGLRKRVDDVVTGDDPGCDNCQYRRDYVEVYADDPPDIAEQKIVALPPCLKPDQCLMKLMPFVIEGMGVNRDGSPALDKMVAIEEAKA
jgi:hypothetical protein